MTKRVLLLGLLLLLLGVAGGGFARQGCPGPNDPCPPPDEPTQSTDPTDPGTQPTQPGSPGAQPTQQNQDRDGDGVPDYVDACPDAAGTGFTNGCPVDAATAVPNNAPVFPVSANCLLGNSQQANLRQFPSTSDEIVGQLRVGEFARGVFSTRTPQGETWYFTNSGGYVRSDIVRTNGNCRQLPQVQAGAVLLHLGTGVIGGLQVFPLQRNLNTLSITSGQAVSPSGAFISLLNEADIESLVFLVMRQAAADMQNDIKSIMDDLRRLHEKEQRETDTIRATQDSASQITAGIEALATLQADIGDALGIVLLIPYGSTEECPMFTKWVAYPQEIIDQLEFIDNVAPGTPCMVQVLFSDARTPLLNNGQFDVRLNSILLDVTP